MLLSNFILLILLVSGICAGLDKLTTISLYACIVVCSELLNRIANSITTDSKVVTKISVLTKSKYEPSKIVHKIKTIFYCSTFLFWFLFSFGILALALGYGIKVGDSFNARLFTAGVYFVLYFYAVFGIRTTQKEEPFKVFTPEAQYYRVFQYLSVYHFVFSLLYIGMYYISENDCIKYKLFDIHDYSIFAVLAYVFCLACERILDNYRIITNHLKNSSYRYEVPFFVSILAASPSFKKSLIKTFEMVSGVDLSKSEIAEYIITHIEPVTIIAIIIFWLLSSVVIVSPDQEGIFYRMGKITGGESFKPGIHFKLPWPFEYIKLYKPYEIKIMNIGFTPDPTKKHIIWAKSHSKENFSLLVGNGVEIVSVDIQLFYKIKDLYKYVTKVQNPESYIEALTYKLLTENTVSQTFDSIMSQNRDSLIANLQQELQKELDKADIGVTAVDLVILAIHPPLEVAPEYEDVISSAIDKQREIVSATTQRIHYVNLREAFATGDIMKTEGDAATAVANAFGEAKSFERRISGYQTDPELEKFRLKLDSIQNMAAKKHLYVIDKSFMRNNDRIILNLQN